MNITAYNNGQRAATVVTTAACRAAIFTVDKVVLNPLRFVRGTYDNTTSFLAGVRTAVRGQRRLAAPAPAAQQNTTTEVTGEQA